MVHKSTALTKTQENTTQESQELSPFPAGHHKAAKNMKHK